ncbi:MAG: GSCFA domain-containing protein [Chitinophagaceae bacterium]|nr:MAG: GSCFA domain-containing protein [Chitinophagaceae bacterium]
MEFMTSIDLRNLPVPVKYGDKIMLVGSCFTEHIGNSLGELRFDVMQNPNGILFDPASVCQSLLSYIDNRELTAADFFQLNEVWNSWAHHSRFSHIDRDTAVMQANASQAAAAAFIREADWLVVTLGSAFSYRLLRDQVVAGIFTGGTSAYLPVANNHRAPSGWFSKQLLEISDIITMLDTCYYRLRLLNPKLKILFTVSPVRHLRDGVVDNNRSKARLIESIHHMTGKFDNLYYFPAYELVIDVLRDYRFFDTDFAHPNYAATSFVLEKFAESCIDPASRLLMSEIKKISIARKHRALQPATMAHQRFLQAHYEKAVELQQRYPFLDLSEDITYFKNNTAS